MNSSNHTVSTQDGHADLRVAEWCEQLEEVRGAGLLRDIDVRSTAAAVPGPATPEALAALIRAYYRDPDPIERAWRVQAERWLELPRGDVPVEFLAQTVSPLVPEEALEFVQRPDFLELRLGPASVRLRRVSRHARSGVVRTTGAGMLNPESFVFALNALLRARGHERRFLPLRGTNRSLVWAACTESAADILAALSLLAEPDARKWREFAGFEDGMRRLAS